MVFSVRQTHYENVTYLRSQGDLSVGSYQHSHLPQAFQEEESHYKKLLDSDSCKGHIIVVLMATRTSTKLIATSYLVAVPVNHKNNHY